MANGTGRVRSKEERPAKPNSHVGCKPVLLHVATTETELFDIVAFQCEVAKRGFSLALETGIPKNAIRNLVGVTVNTSAMKNALECSFSLARWSQEQRAATQSHLPIVIINCSRQVPPSVRADFYRYGSHVLCQATAQQVVDSFDGLVIEAERRARRGIILIFKGRIFPLISYGGREAELLTKGRLLSLLIALSRERREFSAPELATVLNTQTNQVKVYINRLRRLIVNTGRNCGISIGKHEVIRNSGRKGGYWLAANIQGQFPSDRF